MAKPSSKIDWTDGNVSKAVEPTSGKKLLGWTENERPPFQFINWLFYNINEWILWLEERADFHDARATLYDAIVGTVGSGSPATHATLNAVMADSGFPNSGGRIFIMENAVINTIQQITKNNIDIEFRPGVTYSKGSATSALQITGTGIKILNGRFTGFSSGGDKAILIDAISNYNTLLTPRFSNNILDVSDLSPSSQIIGAINE